MQKNVISNDVNTLEVAPLSTFVRYLTTASNTSNVVCLQVKAIENANVIVINDFSCFLNSLLYICPIRKCSFNFLFILFNTKIYLLIYALRSYLDL